MDAPVLTIAAVVLNYRTPDLVVGCLRSLVPELDPAADCAVVVDNESGDGSAERIEAAIAREGWGRAVRLVRAGRNGGFSAGNNAGIAAVRRDAYLLLNSDTWLRPGALAALRRAAAAHPDAGLIGPRLENPDGSAQCSAFRDRSPLGELVEAADTGPLTRWLRRWEVPLRDRAEPDFSDWISFACVLLRRGVVERIGGLDEGYFMYFEDVDYCRRARAAGWRVLRWPEARVVHLQGQSSPAHAARAERRRPPRYYYASRARYFAKFYGRGGLWAANLLWSAGRGISRLRELAGRPRSACEREWRDIWHNGLHPLEAGAPAAAERT
jgi:hypothetical protein